MGGLIKVICESERQPLGASPGPPSRHCRYTARPARHDQAKSVLRGGFFEDMSQRAIGGDAA
jgi:hypothetical protein